MTALHDALDAIDAEQQALAVRQEALAEAAATIRRLLGDAPEPVVPARVPAGAPVVAPKPKPKAAPVEGEQQCPECGKMWKNVQALSVHRARTHGVRSTNPKSVWGAKRRAEKKAADSTPTPIRANVNGAPPDELCLRCDDCPATFHLTDNGKLVAHTVSAHKRDARRHERTPRRAADLEVAS